LQQRRSINRCDGEVFSELLLQSTDIRIVAVAGGVGEPTGFTDDRALEKARQRGFREKELDAGLLLGDQRGGRQFRVAVAVNGIKTWRRQYL
jgi:hypothetical protein